MTFSHISQLASYLQVAVFWCKETQFLYFSSPFTRGSSARQVAVWEVAALPWLKTPPTRVFPGPFTPPSLTTRGLYSISSTATGSPHCCYSSLLSLFLFYSTGYSYVSASAQDRQTCALTTVRPYAQELLFNWQSFMNSNARRRG